MRVSKLPPTQQETTSTAEHVSICLKKYILRPYKERLKLFTILLREIICFVEKSRKQFKTSCLRQQRRQVFVTESSWCNCGVAHEADTTGLTDFRVRSTEEQSN